MEPELTAEEIASKKAIHAARDHAQAIEVAREAQLQAHDDKTREIFAEVIKDSLEDSPSNEELKYMLDEQKKAIQRISDKLDPIVDVYKAVILSKSFVLGLSGVIVAIAAIGMGFTWLINSVIHK